MNGAGIYVFVTIFDTVSEATSTGSVSNAVQNYAAREVQDFILSTYTTCCISDENNCNASSTTTNCTLAETCPPDAPNGGLGLGCYTSAQSIPPFTISASICSFLANDVNPKIVGPVSSGLCGGGDPAAYVDAVFKWLDSNYLTVLVPWGIMVSLLFLNFLGACYYNISPAYDKTHGGPAEETLSV